MCSDPWCSRSSRCQYAGYRVHLDVSDLWPQALRVAGVLFLLLGAFSDLKVKVRSSDQPKNSNFLLTRNLYDFELHYSHSCTAHIPDQWNLWELLKNLRRVENIFSLQYYDTKPGLGYNNSYFCDKNKPDILVLLEAVTQTVRQVHR